MIVAIFEVFEMRCRVEFLVQKYSGPYLKFMKSGVESVSGYKWSGPYLGFLNSG